MIGRSGKYYRAGYLARQAGDWPDGEATPTEDVNGEQAVKYDGSNNPNQSVTVTAPQDTPMTLYNLPLSSKAISTVDGRSTLLTPKSSGRKNISSDSASTAVSARPTPNQTMQPKREPASLQSTMPIPGGSGDARSRMLNYIASCEGHAHKDKHGAEDGYGAYNDSLNYCTTGYGQLLHQSPCTPDDYARYRGETRAEALARLGHDYDTANQYIQNAVPSASDGQKNSFIDQVFNMGIGKPGGQHGVINHSAWKNFISGHNSAVPADILSLNAGGPGIHARRQGEVDMFLNNAIPASCYANSSRRPKK